MTRSDAPLSNELVLRIAALATENAALREQLAALELVAEHAATVIRLLDERGPSIVPYLIDTDDNPGEYLRAALKGATS